MRIQRKHLQTHMKNQKYDMKHFNFHCFLLRRETWGEKTQKSNEREIDRDCTHNVLRSYGRELVAIGDRVFTEINGLCEHEGSILGLFFVLFFLQIGRAEIDARATLQRREEGRSYARSDPIRHAIDLFAR
eukprot:TRINITY_DN5598_c0_g1_i1.p1 TRINITY_DN5598_c0_g1~~TRINITY_DN5598_c0_g1_i1.p1  ORF type:complete len:131 (+),score=9.64 TRINITY_DN5598_c0_g1_i1:36-428(+)